jgi:hypothetical protein
MSALRTATRTLTAAAVLTAAVAGLGAAPATASATESQFVYAGTATITLAAYDYCDLSTSQRHPAGQQTVTLPVELTVSEPVEGETSPLHLTLQTDPAGAPGGFLLTTAQTATTSQGGLVLPFWNVEFDAGSGELAGTLAEDHREEAAAANQFAVVQPLVPCQPQLGTIPQIDAMAEGAQLAGSLGTDGARLEFAGSTVTGLWDYHVSAELTRA